MATYNMDKVSGILREPTYIDSNAQSGYLAILKNVYLWMTLALGISGVTAIAVANSPQLLELLYGNGLALFIVFTAQLGLVWLISARISSMSINTATALFIAYSILTGVTLASIFIVFTQESIASVFFISGRRVPAAGNGRMGCGEQPCTDILLSAIFQIGEHTS